MERKFNYVGNEHLEKTHRSGWKFAAQVLRELHNPQGVNFYSWGDRTLKVENILKQPWSGFLHNVISYPDEYPLKYKNKIFPLDRLVLQDWFHESLTRCRGIFTLSKYSRDFLARHVKVPVVAVWHPSTIFEQQFDVGDFLSKKTLIHIGQWMRKYHSFLDLDTDLKKIFVKVKDFDSDYQEMTSYSRRGLEGIEFLDRLDNRQFDNLITSSVVFLDLYDVCACNTVIECIMMHTPILTRRLPGNEEYLGQEYPFFFESLEEAAAKVQDTELIQETHEYLKRMDKSKYTKEAFQTSIVESAVYKNIPTWKF